MQRLGLLFLFLRNVQKFAMSLSTSSKKVHIETGEK